MRSSGGAISVDLLLKDDDRYPSRVVLLVMSNLKPFNRAWAIAAYELLRLNAVSARMQGKQPILQNS